MNEPAPLQLLLLLCVATMGLARPMTVQKDGLSRALRQVTGRNWTVSGFSECSATCGGGIQVRSVRCLDEDGIIKMDCSLSSKPPSTELCAQINCDTGDPSSVIPPSDTYNFPSIGEDISAIVMFENRGPESYLIDLTVSESDRTSTRVRQSVDSGINNGKTLTVIPASDDIVFPTSSDQTLLMLNGEDIMDLNGVSRVAISDGIWFQNNIVSLPESAVLADNVRLFILYDGFRFYRFNTSIRNPLDSPGNLYINPITGTTMYSTSSAFNSLFDNAVRDILASTTSLPFTTQSVTSDTESSVDVSGTTEPLGTDIPTDQTTTTDQATPTNQAISTDQTTPTNQAMTTDQSTPPDETTPTDQTTPINSSTLPDTFTTVPDLGTTDTTTPTVTMEPETTTNLVRATSEPVMITSESMPTTDIAATTTELIIASTDSPTDETTPSANASTESRTTSPVTSQVDTTEVSTTQPPTTESLSTTTSTQPTITETFKTRTRKKTKTKTKGKSKSQTRTKDTSPKQTRVTKTDDDDDDDCTVKQSRKTGRSHLGRSTSGRDGTDTSLSSTIEDSTTRHSKSSTKCIIDKTGTRQSKTRKSGTKCIVDKSGKSRSTSGKSKTKCITEKSAMIRSRTSKSRTSGSRISESRTSGSRSRTSRSRSRTSGSRTSKSSTSGSKTSKSRISGSRTDKTKSRISYTSKTNTFTHAKSVTTSIKGEMRKLIVRVEPVSAITPCPCHRGKSKVGWPKSRNRRKNLKPKKRKKKKQRG